MKMLSNKKGNMNQGKIENYIMVFVLVLILFKVIATLYPQVTASASELNESGFPLAEFFMDNGVLWYLVAAGLLFLIYKSFHQNKHK